MAKRTLGGLLMLVLLASVLITPPTSAQGKNVLVVAVAGDTDSLDATFALGTSYASIMLCADWQGVGYKPVQLKNGLRTVDTRTYVPRLIEKWEERPLPNGRFQYTWHVRRGMTFHSGNPITAHDILFSWLKRQATRRDTLERNFGYFQADKDVEVVDDYTLRITSSQYAPLIYATVLGQRAFYDSKRIKEMAGPNDPWGDEVMKKDCVAGGPYKLVKWAPGVEMVFERFANWWGNKTWEKSSFDQIVLRVIPAVETRVLLLQRGEVDLALDLPIKEINRLRNVKGVKVLSYPSINLVVGEMNATIKPFDNLKLRQALSYAFPYNVVVKDIYRGDALRMNGPIPTGVPNARRVPVYWTDLERAKKLLSEAGFGGGLEIPMAFDAKYQVHEDIAVLYKANLEKIGVKLNLQKMPSAQFNTETRAKKVPFFMYEILWWVSDPLYIQLFTFFSDTTTNLSNYKNEQVDGLIRKALVTANNKERLQLAQQAENIAIDDVPFIFIAQPNFNIAMRENIEGYVHQNTELHHMWLLRRKP